MKRYLFETNIADTAQTADVVTFSEKILNGKLHGLCSETSRKLKAYLGPQEGSRKALFKKLIKSSYSLTLFEKKNPF